MERPQTRLTDQLGRRSAVWATVFCLLVAAGGGRQPGGRIASACARMPGVIVA